MPQCMLGAMIKFCMMALIMHSSTNNITIVEFHMLVVKNADC